MLSPMSFFVLFNRSYTKYRVLFLTVARIQVTV